MNRRRKLIIALSAGLVLVVVALLLWRSEPRYGGRGLKEWALQAHDHEVTGRINDEGYRSATNAIRRMGPAATRTAVDSLDDLERWNKDPMRKLYARFLPWIEDRFDLDKLTTARVILRTVDDGARATVEARLIAKLASGNRQHAFSLTNFSASTWPRVAPLLQHTNALVVNLTATLGRHWSPPLKLDIERLWQTRLTATNPNVWFELELLLATQAADTNRLARVVGTTFLQGSISNSYTTGRRAKLLAELGAAGRPYLIAGTTNEIRWVRDKAANAMKTNAARP